MGDSPLIASNRHHTPPFRVLGRVYSLIQAETDREEKMIARRTFIKGASIGAIAAVTSGAHVKQSHAQQVPNSVGTERPSSGRHRCHRLPHAHLRPSALSHAT